jgi:acyl carrier protein
MTYFLKNENLEKSTLTPSFIFALIFKDLIKLKINNRGRRFWIKKQEKIVATEFFLTLYLASWKLSCLIIFDLIEDKLGYEKEGLKIQDRLVSDLGADSVDIVEIALYLERVLGIPVYEDVKIEKLIDLIDYVFSVLGKRFKTFELICNSNNLKI